MDDYSAYIPVGEPDGEGRLQAWQTAIGLQAVDGLHPSAYLLKTAKRNIAGDISIDEARRLIHDYYESREMRSAQEADEQEADKVSVNMAKLLGESAFKLIPAALVDIHRRLFEGVFRFAGEIRKVDIIKKEWVLRGDTVLYTPAPFIEESLEWDIKQELLFDYDAASMEQAVEHIGKFIAALWQIHPFAEGNTRTTAVLLIKYLRFMGFAVDNTLFARHSWYFRNALVRANYRNTKKGISKTPVFLLRFLRNLLMGEQHELKNRFLLIPDSDTEQVTEQAESASADVLLSQYEVSIQTLIKVMDTHPYSLKELMGMCSIKHRPTFIENYIKPAIEKGIIKLLYEDKPKHPRQKYLLTIKGVLLHNS